MRLSYALGDDVDLRRRLLIKIGAPLSTHEPQGVTAGAKNHTAETRSWEALQRLTSDIYRAAQAPRAEGETGAF